MNNCYIFTGLLSFLITFAGCSHQPKKQENSSLQEAQKHLYGNKNHPQNIQKAFHHLKKSADQNNPIALDLLGGFYSSGLGGIEKNCSKAIDAFSKSASLGYVESYNNLAYKLATCEDKQLRDPGQAASALRKLYRHRRQVAGYLDTTAAVYAEKGQFDKAVTFQKAAIEILNIIGARNIQDSSFQKNLNRYEQKKRPIDYTKPQLKSPRQVED